MHYLFTIFPVIASDATIMHICFRLWGTVLPAGSVQQQQVILALVCNFGHSVMTLLILSNHSLMVE
jgi:hypothetical protein